MKVTCIVYPDGMWPVGDQYEKKYWWSKKKQVLQRGPQKGDVVTVTKEYWSEGEKYYKLMEWPGKNSYDSRGFAVIEKADFEKVEYSSIVKQNPVSVQ